MEPILGPGPPLPPPFSLLLLLGLLVIGIWSLLPGHQRGELLSAKISKTLRQQKVPESQKVTKVPPPHWEDNLQMECTGSDLACFSGLPVGWAQNYTLWSMDRSLQNIFQHLDIARSSLMNLSTSSQVTSTPSSSSSTTGPRDLQTLTCYECHSPEFSRVQSSSLHTNLSATQSLAYIFRESLEHRSHSLPNPSKNYSGQARIQSLPPFLLSQDKKDTTENMSLDNSAYNSPDEQGLCETQAVEDKNDSWVPKEIRNSLDLHIRKKLAQRLAPPPIFRTIKLSISPYPLASSPMRDKKTTKKKGGNRVLKVSNSPSSNLRGRPRLPCWAPIKLSRSARWVLEGHMAWKVCTLRAQRIPAAVKQSWAILNCVIKVQNEDHKPGNSKIPVPMYLLKNTVQDNKKPPEVLYPLLPTDVENDHTRPTTPKLFKADSQPQTTPPPDTQDTSCSEVVVIPGEATFLPEDVKKRLELCIKKKVNSLLKKATRQQKDTVKKDEELSIRLKFQAVDTMKLLQTVESVSLGPGPQVSDFKGLVPESSDQVIDFWKLNSGPQVQEFQIQETNDVELTPVVQKQNVDFLKIKDSSSEVQDMDSVTTSVPEKYDADSMELTPGSPVQDVDSTGSIPEPQIKNVDSGGLIPGSQVKLTDSKKLVKGSQVKLTDSEGLTLWSQVKLTDSEGLIPWSQVKLKDSKELILESQVKLTDSKGLIPGSQVKLMDSKGLIPGSQVKLMDSKGLIPGSQVKLTDSNGLISGSQARLSDSKKLIPGSQVRLTDSKVLIPGSQARLTDSKGLIPGSQVKLRDSNGLISGVQARLTDTKGLIPGSQVKLTDSKGLIPWSQVKLTDSRGPIAEPQVKLTDSKELISGSQVQFTDTKSLISGSQIKLSDSKELILGTQVIFTDSKGLISGSQVKLTDSEGLIPESQVRLTDSNGLIPGSQVKLIDSNGLIPGSQVKLKDSKGLISWSQVKLTDSKGLIVESQVKLTDSKGLISGSQVKLTDSKGLILGSLIPESQVKLKDSKGLISGSQVKLSVSKGLTPESQVKLTDSKGLISGSQVRLSDSKGLIPGSQVKLKESKGLIPGTQVKLTDFKGLMAGSHVKLIDSEELIQGSQVKLTDSKGVIPDSQVKFTDSKRLIPGSLISGSQVKLTNSKGLMLESQVKLTDSEGLIQGSQVKLTDSKGLIPGSQVKFTDSKELIPGSLISGSQVKLTNSKGLILGSQVKLTDSEGLIQVAQVKLTDSKGLIPGSQVKFTDSKGLIPGSLISGSQVKLTNSKELILGSQVKLTDSEGLIQVAQVKLTDSKGLIPGSQVKFTDSKGLIPGSLISGSQVKLTNSKELMLGSQVKLTDSEGLIQVAQVKLTDSKGLIPDSQVKFTDSKGLIPGSLISRSQVKLTNSKGLMLESQVKLTDSEGLIQVSQVKLTDSKGLISGSEVKLTNSKGLILKPKDQVIDSVELTPWPRIQGVDSVELTSKSEIPVTDPKQLTLKLQSPVDFLQGSIPLYISESGRMTVNLKQGLHASKAREILRTMVRDLNGSILLQKSFTFRISSKFPNTAQSSTLPRVLAGQPSHSLHQWRLSPQSLFQAPIFSFRRSDQSFNQEGLRTPIALKWPVSGRQVKARKQRISKGRVTRRKSSSTSMLRKNLWAKMQQAHHVQADQNQRPSQVASPHAPNQHFSPSRQTMVSEGWQEKIMGTPPGTSLSNDIQKDTLCQLCRKNLSFNDHTLCQLCRKKLPFNEQLENFKSTSQDYPNLTTKGAQDSNKPVERRKEMEQISSDIRVLPQSTSPQLPSSHKIPSTENTASVEQKEKPGISSQVRTSKPLSVTPPHEQTQLLQDLQLKITQQLLKNQLSPHFTPSLTKGMFLQYPICLQCGRCSGPSCPHKFHDTSGPWLLIYPQLRLFRNSEGHGEFRVQLGFKLRNRTQIPKQQREIGSLVPMGHVSSQPDTLDKRKSKVCTCHVTKKNLILSPYPKTNLGHQPFQTLESSQTSGPIQIHIKRNLPSRRVEVTKAKCEEPDHYNFIKIHSLLNTDSKGYWAKGVKRILNSEQMKSPKEIRTTTHKIQRVSRQSIPKDRERHSGRRTMEVQKEAPPGRHSEESTGFMQWLCLGIKKALGIACPPKTSLQQMQAPWESPSSQQGSVSSEQSHVQQDSKNVGKQWVKSLKTTCLTTKMERKKPEKDDKKRQRFTLLPRVPKNIKVNQSRLYFKSTYKSTSSHSSTSPVPESNTISHSKSSHQKTSPGQEKSGGGALNSNKTKNSQEHQVIPGGPMSKQKIQQQDAGGDRTGKVSWKDTYSLKGRFGSSP
ncbi:uncharacterized protein C2orf16-like isoform X3 [Antechinus flavipes]|uniref:uncharacterized protein C2orf16-like isoform X3 n=1 Tax=Antechinus flavipes TaxID=38775 RepID=UPI00223548E6|nr:uncharacterized protein C2orf16-like isoform X3 [Antechinus flavipes]